MADASTGKDRTPELPADRSGADRQHAETVHAINQRIFETSIDLILVVSGYGTYIRVSPSAMAILGYDPEEMVGHSAVDFIYPDDLENTRSEMRLARRAGGARTFECRYVHKDGRAVTLEWKGVWSEPARQYFFIGRDITEIKETERQLREARMMDALFREGINGMPEGFAIWDDEARLVVCNDSYRRLLATESVSIVPGVSLETVLREGLALGVFPDAVGREEAWIADRVREHHAEQGTIEQRLNDGRWVLVSKHQMANGRTVGLRVDITAQKTAEARLAAEYAERRRAEDEVRALNEALEQRVAERTRELNEANQKLTTEIAERYRVEAVLRQAQKLEAIGRLAGGVAHNFNNLLMVVLGNLELAREEHVEDEDYPLRLATAKRAAERGAMVTRQLLAFAGHQTMNLQVIEPAARLRDFSTLLGQSLRGDIVIETAIAADLWAVEIDPSELELALLNLGLNARDAMPAGGILRIAAANRTLHDRRLDLDGDYLVIEITDNGSGIAPENLARVFEPFFTTKGFAYGSGLGLSQVHGFAKQSLGVVDIESELGKGTTVRLYLPATAQRPGPRPDSVAQAPHGHLTSGTILVVEDDLDVADVAVSLLRRCGFTVRLADRARVALEMLRGGDPVDLIFSDILMPDGMSGIEMAEAVMRRFPKMPILLTTGYSEAADEAKARGLQIVAKPYGADELCARIGALLVGHPGDAARA